MVTLLVMYPETEGAHFDMDYYLNKHIPLVQDRVGDAIKYCSVEQGLGGAAPGSPATYRVIARICVDSMDEFLQHVAPHDPEFSADVPNFTNITPVIQIDQVVL